jgi:integrase
MVSNIAPVHPKLTGFGFNYYVAERRKIGRGKLFPELSMASTGYYSDNFSKWFANFLEKSEAKKVRTSFHSFRHNFRDALRNAQVKRERLCARWMGKRSGWRRKCGGKLRAWLQCERSQGSDFKNCLRWLRFQTPQPLCRGVRV